VGKGLPIATVSYDVVDRRREGGNGMRGLKMINKHVYLPGKLA
jgi:hypothetical protein